MPAQTWTCFKADWIRRHLHLNLTKWEDGGRNVAFVSFPSSIKLFQSISCQLFLPGPVLSRIIHVSLLVRTINNRDLTVSALTLV